MKTQFRIIAVILCFMIGFSVGSWLFADTTYYFRDPWEVNVEIPIDRQDWEDGKSGDEPFLFIKTTDYNSTLGLASGAFLALVCAIIVYRNNLVSI